MFCTIREFSRETNLSCPHIRKLIEEGKLPYIKSGSRFLLSKADALSALEELFHQPEQR